MLRIWISRQKLLKLPMGVAGPFFELQPWNLVRIDIGLSCKSAEILIRISQTVSELEKISVSVLSISWDVLDYINKLISPDRPPDWFGKGKERFDTFTTIIGVIIGSIFFLIIVGCLCCCLCPFCFLHKSRRGRIIRRRGQGKYFWNVI